MSDSRSPHSFHAARALLAEGWARDVRLQVQDGRIAEIGVTRNGSRQILLTGTTYHPFGPVKRWSFGNGLELRRALDLDGRPLAVEDGPALGPLQIEGEAPLVAVEVQVVGGVGILAGRRLGPRLDPHDGRSPVGELALGPLQVRRADQAAGKPAQHRPEQRANTADQQRDSSNAAKNKVKGLLCSICLLQ